ncbi:MAG: dynamin family protein [Acetobacterium woodii]|nr:dynamin family protein [Acetobacterium woodii]
MNKDRMMMTLNDVVELLIFTDVCNDDIIKIRNLQTKIQNKELVISVIGQFKRGKTSFINAVLGAEVLPVGIIPVTSVATKIQFGEARAVVHYQNDEETSVSLDELEGFISEQANPNNNKGVAFVNLYLPYDFLKDGVTLVDTPGVGSIHQNNTDEAYAFMKDSVAIIFMLSVDSPINEIEREFLSTAKNYASKFYFTVNKIDTISSADLEAYLGYCHQIIGSIMDEEKIELFPISAKTKSGMAELFAQIEGDIEVSVDSIIMDSMQIKFGEVLSTTLSHLELYRSATSMPLENLEEKRLELVDRLGRLDQITKEASFYLLQNIDDLLEQIRTTLSNGSEELKQKLKAVLETVYQENSHIKSKQLEKQLTAIMENDLNQHLSELSDLGLITLSSGYERLAEVLNKKINDLKDFLKTLVFELFGISYHYENTVHTLSIRDDFYVRVNQKPSAFLVDMNDLVYLMPRSVANKKIINRYFSKMENDVDCNINNMIYNYQYKIRESVRSFKSVLQNESDTLKTDLEELVNRVIADKEDTSQELGEKIAELDDVCQRLTLVLGELWNK